jgi:hypothetical protein
LASDAGASSAKRGVVVRAPTFLLANRPRIDDEGARLWGTREPATRAGFLPSGARCCGGVSHRGGYVGRHGGHGWLRVRLVCAGC